jgi:hypothetical protein
MSTYHCGYPRHHCWNCCPRPGWVGFNSPTTATELSTETKTALSDLSVRLQKLEVSYWEILQQLNDIQAK